MGNRYGLERRPTRDEVRLVQLSPRERRPLVRSVARAQKGRLYLGGWIKAEGIGTGAAGIRLQLDFRPGGINQWFTTDVIQGTTDWTYYRIDSIVVPQDMRVAVRLENYAGASGTAWFDDITLQQQLPPPIDSFLLYPNYRGMLFDDGPSLMRFDLTVTPPNGDFGRVKVTGVLSDEATAQVVASWTGFIVRFMDRL